MCFGVRDALAATRALADPQRTTIYGELVHNEIVQQELAARGFHQVDEERRASQPLLPQVLITAHGVSDRERDALRARGHQLVDTTCPLVARAHAAAKELAAEGRHVVVLGRPGHVEVRGLVGDLRSWSVVSNEAEVATWPYDRLGVLAQTTMPEATARALLVAIQRANPHADVAFRDTVCAPTKQRLQAVLELARRVDAMIVVGGKASNNTRQLVHACASVGTPVQHVQGSDDLDRSMLAGCSVVGLTAGTSTTDEVLDAVEAALAAITPASRPV